MNSQGHSRRRGQLLARAGTTSEARIDFTREIFALPGMVRVENFMMLSWVAFAAAWPPPIRKRALVDCRCSDVPPPSNWTHPTCAQQHADTRNCEKRRLGELRDGYCDLTCGVCAACSPSPPLPPLPRCLKPIGSFNDRWSPHRALPYGPGPEGGHDHTWATCEEQCPEYQYIGLEKGECFCGSSLAVADRYGTSPFECVPPHVRERCIYIYDRWCSPAPPLPPPPSPPFPPSFPPPSWVKGHVAAVGVIVGGLVAMLLAAWGCYTLWTRSRQPPDPALLLGKAAACEGGGEAADHEGVELGRGDGDRARPAQMQRGSTVPTLLSAAAAAKPNRKTRKKSIDKSPVHVGQVLFYKHHHHGWLFVKVASIDHSGAVPTYLIEAPQIDGVLETERGKLFTKMPDK